MSFEQILQQAVSNWESLYSGRTIHVLVGTATCGRAAGSMAVLEALRHEIEGLDVQVAISEVGCMGLCSYEPLVTIIKPNDFAICYHHVTPQLVPRLVQGYVMGDDPCLDLALGALTGGGHEPAVIPELERFAHEKRLLLRNSGYTSPLEIEHYLACEGYKALAKALITDPEILIEEVERSGLRGRGGAGFPTAAKWRTCYAAKSDTKYVVCNADEGDPGAFMDRILLESDPHAVIEGMAIAGYAIGAQKGFIYIREEYPLAISRIQTALMQSEEKGLLGKNILDSSFNFDIEIVKGAGAFVSGEETAMTAAMEGRRSWPEHRPPYPSEAGLWGRPTLVNNVKTLAYIPLVVNNGGKWFRGTGTKESPGTALFALAGKLINTGLAEVPMGTTLRTLVYDIGGGTRENKQFKGVQIGGPSGGCLPEALLDTPVDFDSLKEAGAIMGSGGIIVMDEDNCMVDTAKFFIDFSQQESCGKCTPCRIGTFHMLDILQDVTKGLGTLEGLSMLEELGNDVKAGSLCGLGKMAPNPVLTTLRYYKDEYKAHILEKRCPAGVCKDLTAYYILPEKCEKGCDHCVLACPAEAVFSDENGLKVVDQSKCTKCGSCELVCPVEYNAVIRLSPVSLVPENRRVRPDTPSKEP
ncbi:MAG: NADH-ubiquinone oxidoreductase-F iron-sulfur binding region domain-containing protein [Dehalococcoidia bacterium]|jgi:NADH-quinone oxidoreductase subunit F